MAADKQLVGGPAGAEERVGGRVGGRPAGRGGRDLDEEAVVDPECVSLDEGLDGGEAAAVVPRGGVGAGAEEGDAGAEEEDGGLRQPVGGAAHGPRILGWWWRGPEGP